MVRAARNLELTEGACSRLVCFRWMHFFFFSTPDSSTNHSIISKFLLWMHRLHIWMTHHKSSLAIGFITAGSIVRLRSVPHSTSLMSVMYLRQFFMKNGPTNYVNRHGPHCISHFEIHLFDCDSMFLGQAWNKGCQMVEVALALEKSLLNHNGHVCTLKAQLLENSLHHSFTNVDIPAQLDEAQMQWNWIQDALGVESLTLLQELRGSEYLWLQMNAHALKQHIWDWLHQCKFELEQLKRAYHHMVNGVPAS